VHLSKHKASTPAARIMSFRNRPMLARLRPDWLYRSSRPPAAVRVCRLSGSPALRDRPSSGVAGSLPSNFVSSLAGTKRRAGRNGRSSNGLRRLTDMRAEGMTTPIEAIYGSMRNHAFKPDVQLRIRQLAGVVDQSGNVIPGYVRHDNGCIVDASTVGHG
jgi:hypothetical protein